MNHRQLVLRTLLLAITFCSLSEVAFSQRRGEVVQGLLRGFLDIQLEKERRKAVEREKIRERQRKRAVRVPNDPTAPLALRSYRTRLAAFSNQSAILARSLQSSSGRVRGVRPLMPQALTLHTRAELMHKKSLGARDLALLREEYSKLDFQWRELSFRLRQLRGLDRVTLARVKQLDGYCDDICTQLELQPQFDRRSVFRLNIETTAHLGTLLEDIQLELHDLANTAALARECRGLTEQCRRLGDLANDGSYENVITKYSTFVSDWRRFAVKLYSAKNAHCERSIRRVHSCNHRVFEQLRKPLSIDRAYLRYVSHALTERVNAMFENMTVKTLVQLPAAEQQTVLQLARSLYGNCQRYSNSVDNDSPLNELVTNYVRIDNQWPALDRHLRLIKSSSVATSRRMIRAYELELRSLLHVPARLDRAHAIQLAASLETSAQHLRYDTRRYARYYSTTAFRGRAFRSSDAFYAQAKQLHTLLQKGSDLGKIRESTNGMLRSWRSFSIIISSMPKNGLSRRRYEYIHESRQDVVPVLTELATLLGG